MDDSLFEILQPDGTIIIDDGAWWDYLDRLQNLDVEKAGPLPFLQFLKKGRVEGHYRTDPRTGKKVWVSGYERQGQARPHELVPAQPEKRRGIEYATQLPLFPDFEERRVPAVPGGMIHFGEGTIEDDAGAFEWARDGWAEWANGLDADDREAMDQYVQEMHRVINTDLRYEGEGFPEVPSWLEDAARKYLSKEFEELEAEFEDLEAGWEAEAWKEEEEYNLVSEYIGLVHDGMSRAVDSGKAPDNMVVYRGFGHLDGKIPDFKVGDEFSDKGFSSTSLIRGWVERHFARGLMAQIHVPAGYPCAFPEAAGITGRSREWEVILKPDTVFRVEGVGEEGWLVLSVVME